MKILITGFDPFGEEKINPAYEAVKLLPDVIKTAEIYKLEIPTVMNTSIEKTIDKIEEIKPDIVINVGQAGGRYTITPEKVAINLNDFRIPDNEGNQVNDEVIYEDGENAYFTTLPVKSMVKKMNDEGIPASLSYSAGSFICNHIMYGILYYINKNNLNIKSGFIHIPYMTEQVVDKKNQPSLSLDTLRNGLIASIEAAIENEEDISEIGGEIC